MENEACRAFLGVEELAKKGDFEGRIGFFEVKKGQKWASLFTFQ